MDDRDHATHVMTSFARLRIGGDAQVLEVQYDPEGDWWVGMLESASKGAFRLIARVSGGKWKVIDYGSR